ncbi:MAG TPA: hypothetical protein VE907_06035 [Gammaproteobacteria bacterium]|nr:hypothetical protein [Gammaproteobacteria bacterium]
MAKKTIPLILLIVLAAFVGWRTLIQGPRDVFAYIACADRKVYAVNLLDGTVLRESEVVNDIGRPTSIALAADSTLFITSERGRGQNDYYPLIAIGLEDLDVRGTYTLNPRGEEQLRNDAPDNARLAAYSVVASPNGRTLYLGLSEASGGLTTLFDAVAGKVTGRSNVPILPGNYYLSPYRAQVAEIWPSGSRAAEEGGASAVREWSGGVLVRDIQTGEVVSRAELMGNRGLTPPWTSEPGPYLHIKPGTTEFDAYDRGTGELIADIDLRRLTGMSPMQDVPTAIPNSTFAALAMVDEEGHGFAVVIDTSSKQVRSKTQVGPSPTNLVLASGTN